MIAEGTLLIDTEGARIGQVNGLSVIEIGGYVFGKPVRITASAALGKIRADQYRARIQYQRPPARQGHANHRRLFALAIRAG